MSKYIGQLNAMLRDPNPDANGGDIYGGTVAPAAPVVPAGGDPLPGSAPAAGDGTEDFGGAGDGGDGDLNAGGDGQGDPADGGQGDGQPALGDDGQPIVAVKPPVAPVAPATLRLDPETIAELRRQSAPQGAGDAQPQLSKEQITALLNPVVVNEDMMKSLGFDAATPEQVQGFQNFANATVKNAVSVARLMIERQVEKFEQALGPIFQERERQSMEAARTDFYKGFSHLQKYDKIVRAAAREVNHLKEGGGEKTKQEIFQEVAAKTVSILAEAGVRVNLPPPANLGAGGRTTVPQPNRSAAPGRSGGGNSQSNKPNNPDADIYKR